MARTPAQAGKAGSPAPGEPVYLAIGQLRRPHGVRGDIIMEILTDFPERIRVGTQILVGEKHEELTITRVRQHNEGLLLGLKGFDSPETVGRLRNLLVYVPTADRPSLPEGQYYHHQILGIKVYAETDVLLGELTEIINTGANDVYVVVNESGRELLLPDIAEVILSIDVEANAMRVHLLPGLLDDAAEA